MDWNHLARLVLDGHTVTRDEALAILDCPDEELLLLLHGAFKIRRSFFGKKVRVHVLQNAKSGACQEDCAFCSQSIRYKSPIERYKTQTVEELVQGAEAAYEAGAVTYCMVTATRAPSDKDIDTVCEAVRIIKDTLPIRVCTSLGLLSELHAQALAGAGVDRYNHNLETSERFYPEVVSTHQWSDRGQTLRVAKAAGMEACAGGIVGMGETLDDRVDLALSLRELGVDSVPVNLLDPRPATPLEAAPRLRPQEALKSLAMFRFIHPDTEIRLAGGREAILGTMQPLALYAVNSIFSNGYLTTGGQGASDDRKMLEEAGFEPVYLDERPHIEPKSGVSAPRSM
jgi:biotin synthase